MKKLTTKLLATTSALALVYTSAVALDIKTSGGVEYRYTETKSKGLTQNPQLSRANVNIKMTASGVSNGLAYGAYIQTKSDDMGAESTLKTVATAGGGYKLYGGGRNLKAGGDPTVAYSFANGERDTGLNYQALTSLMPEIRTDAVSGKWYGIWSKVGETQDGKDIWAHVTARASRTGSNLQLWRGRSRGADANAGNIDGFAIGDKPDKFNAQGADSASDNVNPARHGGDYTTAGSSATTGTAGRKASNNATTQSAMWVGGSFGEIIIGQSGNATDVVPTGAVKASYFVTGTQASTFTAGNMAERVTYTTPEFVQGMTVQYTHSFKGNVSTVKSQNITAPTSWGVQYNTALSGVNVKLGYASANPGKKQNEKSRKNTKMGMELNHGNITVGYGTFSNGKKGKQTKRTTGKNYGIKYAQNAWAVGYTIKKSQDKNKYLTASNKTGKTKAITASYQVADGFKVYASKSKNAVKNTAGKATKKSYTVLGAKIAF